MGRVVDGRVNGAPFAGIVLTAGSVLRADDAAGPVLSKKMEDAPHCRLVHHRWRSDARG